MTYIHFTEEQKYRASCVDLVEFLRRQGEKLIRSGPEYRMASDHSVTVRGNEWYDHAAKEGGGPISFVQNYCGLSYPEAVTRLLEGEQGQIYEPAPRKREEPKKEFIQPPVSREMRRVYAYLLKKRLIDREVLSTFVWAGLIYEDEKYHNAVFAGKDEHGVVRHAHKRSTSDIGKTFRINVEGSDPRYSFHWNGTSDRLYVIAEEPVVPDNASIFRNKGINLVTVPMEPDGMDLAKLETAIRKYAPKFIYTMPNYHNPTGIVMSLEKRKKLLELAGRYCIPIIEEDSQRDFRYEGNRLPSLYAQDRYRSVIYIDSFTLTFPYGIKTGYIVGPTDLIETLERLIVVDETFVSSLGQYILNEYIERGYYQTHIGHLVKHYAHKRDLLCQCLDGIADKGITYTKPRGGLLLWCDLEERINERRLYHEAESRGLLIMPGFLFYPKGYEGGGHVRLCFSNISDADIERGVQILSEALEHSVE